MNWFFLILLLAVFFGYLIGSFPSAYIIGRIFARVDIRKEGSGNIGATNVFRVSGILPGIITLILDMGKGFLATWGGRWILTSNPQMFRANQLEKFIFLPLFIFPL